MSRRGRSQVAAITDLLELAGALATERDRHALAHRVLAAAARLANAEYGRCYVLDRTKRNLVAQGGYLRGAISASTVVIPLIKDSEQNRRNMVANAAFTGKVATITDPYRYSGFDFSMLYDYDRGAGIRTYSLLTAPMRNHEGLTIGVIELGNRIDPASERLVEFDQEAVEIVSTFARQAAVSFNNLRLIEENDRLIRALDGSNRELREENERLRKSTRRPGKFDRIIGQSPAMQEIYDLLDRVVDTDATVLIQGETGTGKELVAGTLHYASKRAGKGFVAQNCTAIPETLLESELFGYKKGAFSGADSDKKGLIELADGGTLFLDEIGDMPLALQAKLLRVLQERELRPLGSGTSIPVDIRVVAATHADLKKKIEDGSFREDLYYRLAVFPLLLPPLRERPDDIALLIEHFVKASAEAYSKRVKSVTSPAMECFLSYSYPGNVRELRNLVERAVLMVEDGAAITPEHLAFELTEGSRAASAAVAAAPTLPDVDHAAGKTLKDLISSTEADAIRHMLNRTDGNQTQAARALGISRRTLIDKMQRYAIASNDLDALTE